KKSPGQNIDVFLRPLVDELITLYNDGIETYDAARKENFIMKAGNLVGFDCHQNFLPSTHPYRKDKRGFIAGNVVLGGPPLELNSDQVWEQICHYPTIYEGNPYRKTNQKLSGFGRTHNWVKRSIFWELLYWHTLLIRHNLDVMHIEKNVFENLFNTVMDGYASNLGGCVSLEDQTFYSFKSHECHVFMQRLLPIALRGMIPNSNMGLSIVEIICKLEKIVPPGFFDSMEHLTKSNIYGMLEEVIEVAYRGVGHCVVILFKCKWFDAARGVRIDNKHNIVDIKYKSRLINDEPFVLASQVEQVYYAPYPSMTKDLKDWWVVVKTKSKSMYELEECENEEDVGDNANEDEFFQERELELVNNNGDETQTELSDEAEQSDEVEFLDNSDESDDDSDVIFDRFILTRSGSVSNNIGLLQQEKQIPLSEEEIALDVASSEGTMSSSGGEEVDYDMTNYGYDDYE
ncbi:outer envelope protein 80, chloroplastic, partial [Tanacetum coccineum]